MQLKKAASGDEAGLTVYMFESSHYDLLVKQLADGKQAVVLRYQLNELTHTEKEVILPQGKVQLRVKAATKSIRSSMPQTERTSKNWAE